jgi:hypothetical protein
MKLDFKTLWGYLKQESTWRGLILVATIAGVNILPEQQETIISAGVILFGVILTFRNDDDKPTPTQ